MSQVNQAGSVSKTSLTFVKSSMCSLYERVG